MIQNNNQNFLDTVKKYSNPKIGFVFIFLIIFQFCLIPFVSPGIQGDYNRYADYMYLYAICSYTMIVLGIVIFQAHGLELLSDHFSLWLIIFTCFARTRLGGSHELSYSLYLGFLGLALSIYVIKNRRKFTMPDGNTVFVGFLWSVGTVLILAIEQAAFSSNNLTSLSLPPNPINQILKLFLYNISFTTVIEEVCFRGLIVGYMIMNGYKEDTAFFVQAILYWGVHYITISYVPVWFFIGIPLLTLSTTLIMRKYKMIFLPIMVHTSVNVFINIFIFGLQRYFS